MKIQYLKLISGEDVVAQVEDIDETSETITLIQPFVISLAKVQGYHQYTAHRWNLFLDDGGEDKVSIKRNMVMFSNMANDYVMEMYSTWIRQDEDDEDDISDIMQELNADYLKRIH